jgi:Ca-activated chloride channel family protein
MIFQLLTRLFAHPWLLAGVAALPLLVALAIIAWFGRRRALAKLGNALAVRRQLHVRTGVRRWRFLCILCGVLLLAVACAGPQWGREYGASRPAGGDLVVVLDLSRSMQAEQPSRLERALRLLRDLADTLQARGGRRVALVVFAAEPRLLFPLTPDYDHFRHSLRHIENDDIAPLLPGPDTPLQSGTRIGAALRLAVAATARAGRPAILLLSDGDDPAADDEEWLVGTLAARTKQIPVYTVGVGDPDQPRTIPDGSDVLRYRGAVVETRLNEKLLEEIARRTNAVYLPAYTHALPLGTLMLNLLAQQPAAEDVPADDALPVYQQQYAWFVAPALALFLLSLLCNEGPGGRLMRNQPRPVAARAGAGLRIFLPLVLFAGATPPDAEPLVREGNAAFADSDYEQALWSYERAERGATDPGLVAFNRAAACYRMGRFAEAVAGYRQCLDDDQVPPARRARARYDLGTALLKQSGGNSAALLRQAVGAFRACLAEPTLEPDLAKDARHNLELAQLLWLRARAAGSDNPEDGGAGPDPEPKGQRPGSADSQKKDNGNSGKGEPQEMQPGESGHPKAGDGAKDKLQAGPLQVLPDSDEVRPLPPAEADEQLERIIARITRERRLHWQQSARPAKDARNW